MTYLRRSPILYRSRPPDVRAGAAGLPSSPSTESRVHVQSDRGHADNGNPRALTLATLAFGVCFYAWASSARSGPTSRSSSA